MSITNAELTQMKERAEKAAVGDWIYDKNENEIRCGIYTIAKDTEYEEDATFIAHSREDVPRLVAEVERLQHEVGEHSAHNGHLIATEIIPLKQENKRLQARLSAADELLAEIHPLMNDLHLYETEIYERVGRYVSGEETE